MLNVITMKESIILARSQNGASTCAEATVFCLQTTRLRPDFATVARAQRVGA
jgi:hypothetical protein